MDYITFTKISNHSSLSNLLWHIVGQSCWLVQLKCGFLSAMTHNKTFWFYGSILGNNQEACWAISMHYNASSLRRWHLRVWIAFYTIAFCATISDYTHTPTEMAHTHTHTHPRARKRTHTNHNMKCTWKYKIATVAGINESETYSHCLSLIAKAVTHSHSQRTSRPPLMDWMWCERVASY